MGCGQSKRSQSRQDIVLRGDDDDYDGDRPFKVVVIGNKAVGKSCLVLRVTRNEFVDRHAVTIGAAFKAKTINVGTSQVKLHLWDTAGEEMYRAMTRSFYREADACILCYDVTDAASFSAAAGWLKEFQQERPHAIIVLVGNKADLHSRQVDTMQAQAFVDKHGLALHIEASAKTGSNVAILFESVATRLVQKRGVGLLTAVTM